VPCVRAEHPPGDPGVVVGGGCGGRSWDGRRCLHRAPRQSPPELSPWRAGATRERGPIRGTVCRAAIRATNMRWTLPADRRAVPLPLDGRTHAPERALYLAAGRRHAGVDR
jgi:hypothetical protein